MNPLVRRLERGLFGTYHGGRNTEPKLCSSKNRPTERRGWEDDISFVFVFFNPYSPGSSQDVVLFAGVSRIANAFIGFPAKR